MSWEEIKGQSKAVSYLKNALDEEKVSSAYLFIGSEGIGKRLVAKNFAKALNCPQKKNHSEYCNQCPACLKIDNFNHPDISWIKVLENSQKISIEQIRRLREKIMLKPYEGKVKVYVILEAELLTEEAANALLKTLEEPPPNSTLILTASNIERLLPTIVSRCQVIKFSNLAFGDIEEVLKNNYNLEQKEISFLTKLSEGRLGEAVRLKDRDILIEKNEIINRVRNYDLEFTANEKKEDIERIFKIMLSWYRDILVFKYSNPDALINIDRQKDIGNAADKISLEKTITAIKSIVNAYSLIQQNANLKLTLEMIKSELKHA